MAWAARDVEIIFDDGGTDDPVVTASIVTPSGVFEVMAEPKIVSSPAGKCLELDRFHIHGRTHGPNMLGATRLRWLAVAVMEAMEVDEVLIRGATRTSGAAKGRRPGDLRFKRTRGPHA
jgi:hypothetical protein